uniref:Uncharacterized protein n=1 Tax=viral metagenome TaxID=1070528 RepID=A0A6M3JQ22_9ZZZZ
MGAFADRITAAKSQYITWWTLSMKRNYVIDKIKLPLLNGIVLTASLIPKLTKEVTSEPNTHRLLEIQDKFFECERNPNRNSLFRAVWKVVMWVYEHDGDYRHRIDWVIEQIVKMVNDGSWQPRTPNKPAKRHWREFDDKGITPKIN